MSKESNYDNTKAHRLGFKLAHPLPGEGIVISGLSGKFPISDNSQEFRKKLYTKVDMVTSDIRPWTELNPLLPARCGKLKDLTKFDAGYFGIHQGLASVMDPMIRLMSENAVEAVIDSGVNPVTLEGSNTGVYIGSCGSDAELDLFRQHLPNIMLGCIRSQIAQRISYHLQLNGPSVIVDSACSSSSYALELAYKDIRSGKCEQAIVGGVNLCLSKKTTIQFYLLGVLSPEGATRAFDADGNGYVRSESACTVFLQKEKHARRIYSHIVHSKVNSDGYKTEGITYPVGVLQAQFMDEFYKECGICPSEVGYVEAHATGTTVGDPEEASAIVTVFCKNRTKPLLIGSVKSNIGHTEPSSGLCSIAKVIFAFDSGVIAPNIHFVKPRPAITALHDGRLKVVTEKTAWHDKHRLAAVNNFGFGGANGHCLLSPNEKIKLNCGQPDDDLPRLVCVSGRTKQTIMSIFDDIKSRKLDVEYIRLYHEIFSEDIVNDKYRGYAVYNKSTELERSINIRCKSKRICFQFNSFDVDWINILKQLLRLPIFRNALARVHDIITKSEVSNQEDFMETLISMIAAQIGLIETMNAIEVVPDYVIGESIGEFFCAYGEGLINLEQLVYANYYYKLSMSNNNQDDSNIVIKHLTKLLSNQMIYSKKWIQQYKYSDNGAETPLNTAVHPGEMKSKSLPNNTLMINFGQTKCVKTLHLIEATDALHHLLSNIGRLYENDVKVKIAKLYPDIKWPVANGTPMISPLLKWEHGHVWYVPDDATIELRKHKLCKINPNTDWEYLGGHVIDGTNLFPAAGYLYLVWCFLSEIRISQCRDVVFEDIKFLHASKVSKFEMSYIITLQSNGEFEIAEEDTVLVTGIVNTRQIECNEFMNNTDLKNRKDDSDQLPLLATDIYKELKLRGYQYSGQFRGIKEANNTASEGILNWNGNWVTFIDCMLQLNILHMDTRNLYVPTGIAKLVISPSKQDSLISNDGTVQVYCLNEANITSGGGVEILGLTVTQLSKRKLQDPVLEYYNFVPNEGSMDLEMCMRVNTQIILENSQETNFKLAEIFDDQPHFEKPLCTHIQKALFDQPIVRPDIKLLTNRSFELPGIVTENVALNINSNYLLVIGVALLRNLEVLTDVIKSISQSGYIISREEVSFEPKDSIPGLEIITCYKTGGENIVLLKRCNYNKAAIVEIGNSLNDLNWIPKLHKFVDTNSDLVIVSQNIQCSGILGFVNCLRREPGKSNIRCISILDDISKLNPYDKLYDRQIKKGMAINIYKDGKWGTCRHLAIETSIAKETENVFLSVRVPGDMSTLTWVEGPLILKEDIDKTHVIVDIYYAALNFRDILTACGKIPVDFGIKTRILRSGFQGLEFSGRDSNGKRVFGMAQRGGLSSLLVADRFLLWDIPDEWTMADAATIPVVYSTVLFALVSVANIRKGQTILIHAGSGGVGQAAINVALYYGCTVFTTVGSIEKKDFIKKCFPQIKEEHIGNSRDVSFEQMIYDQTNGRGVDIVLNSLAAEKLQATVRCVAKNGYHLEIGKVDLMKNNDLNLNTFGRGIKVIGIMLDSMFDSEKTKFLNEILSEHIKSGAVKPMQKVIYQKDDIESAFRFMATGKHIGKIVIQIRPTGEGEGKIPYTKQLFECKSMFYCNPNKTYIIVGGLGGFGMELADWLIVKGCKQLILVSRNGLKNGYQALRLRFWQKYTSVVRVSVEDVTTRNGCLSLLRNANGIGPVDGIFNLAVELKDAPFEKQTMETFRTSLKPKAVATQYLDEVSRELCPYLRYFVVFSSVSAGRGNPGQTNYGLANSIMENICEKRRSEGFPALAIQWGAVGDVGLVADMNAINREVVIGGTLQQKIANCLEVLDIFLCHDKVIVSSMVVAEKEVNRNIQDKLCNILGIKNIKMINLHTCFPELGMDSITSLEIKYIIETHYQIALTVQDMKTMTFHKLEGMSINPDYSAVPNVQVDMLKLDLDEARQAEFSIIPLRRLNLLTGINENLPEVTFLPGIGGFTTIFEPLITKLNCQAYGCQYLFEYPNDNAQLLAKEVVKHIKRGNSTFTLVAYSFGCVVAMEVMALLEAEGYVGKAILIDGTPQYLKFLTKPIYSSSDENENKVNMLLMILERAAFHFTKEFNDQLASCLTFDGKLNFILANTIDIFSSPYFEQYLNVAYSRIKAVVNYERSFQKLKSTAKLLRQVNFYTSHECELSELFEDTVEVKIIENVNHESIIESFEVAEYINKFIEGIDK